MKHKDLIIKWANGAKIEFYDHVARKWKLVPFPCWEDHWQFREHNPARAAFENGKKVLARDENEWTRLKKDSDFDFNWDDYEILESDTYWKDRFATGAKLEFCFISTPNEWLPVTHAFVWDSNSAFKFRELKEVRVTFDKYLISTTRGDNLQLEVPLTLHNFTGKKIKIELDFTNGLATVLK